MDTSFYSMGTKMKGIFNRFKYIAKIFVYNEHEMEIGYPTDVRHVAHVGWDGSSMNTPSWMNEYEITPEFSATSLMNFGQTKNIVSWTSKEIGPTTTGMLQQDGSDPFAVSFARETPLPKAPRKKTKDSSAGKSSKAPESKPSADKLGQKHVEPEIHPYMNVSSLRKKL